MYFSWAESLTSNGKEQQVNLLQSCMGAMCPDDRKQHSGGSYLQYTAVALVSDLRR